MEGTYGVVTFPSRYDALKTFNNDCDQMVIDKEIVVSLILQKYRHFPNIRDYSRDDGWILMERCGRSLVHYLADEDLRYDEEYVQFCTRLLTFLIEAISIMHSRELYHRDIRPCNILFDGTTFRLIDFSISTHLIDDTIVNDIEEFVNGDHRRSDIICCVITVLSVLLAPLNGSTRSDEYDVKSVIEDLMGDVSDDLPLKTILRDMLSSTDINHARRILSLPPIDINEHQIITDLIDNIDSLPFSTEYAIRVLQN